MALNPKSNEEKMLKVLNGWKTLAPTKMFGGLKLEEYETQVNKSLAPRQRLDALEDEKLRELANRDGEDVTTMANIQFIVNGVLADPSEGPNSALYESFGYIRKEDRKSGLTRKKKESIPPTT
jgi:hypothetical protein